MVETYTVTAGQTLDLVVVIFEPCEREITINLAGAGAKASLLCLVATDERNVVLNVNQNHLVAGTTSSVLIKGVLTGSAHARLTGLITIAPDASGCHASQYHKVLLLEKPFVPMEADRPSGGIRTPSATATPQFAVSHHQVRCNHGAAVGKIDSQQLFYLQTRGLSEHTATKIIVNGFAQEIIAHENPIPHIFPS